MLKAVLTEVLVEVINSLSLQIRKNLQTFIWEEVYTKAYYPNFVYEGGDGTAGSGEASMEFMEAFRWKGSKKSVNEVTNELFYAYQNMTVDRVTGRHFENGKDMRSKLADLLNTNGIFGHKQRGAYWDKFLDDLDKSIDYMFMKELKRIGLNVV